MTSKPLPKWIAQVAYLIVEQQGSNSRYSGDHYMGDDERRETEASVAEIIVKGAAPLIVIASRSLKVHHQECDNNPCTCGADDWNQMVKEAIND